MYGYSLERYWPCKDLSTVSFLNIVKRFAPRRGKPEIHPDSGFMILLAPGRINIIFFSHFEIHWYFAARFPHMVRLFKLAGVSEISFEENCGKCCFTFLGIVYCCNLDRSMFEFLTIILFVWSQRVVTSNPISLFYWLISCCYTPIGCERYTGQFIFPLSAVNLTLPTLLNSLVQRICISTSEKV